MPPHIVLVLADDLGWGGVGYLGSPALTPAIDALAAEGAVLDRLYAAPRCSPSRASLLTGAYPWRHAAWLTNTPEERDDGVDPRYTFLPELLAGSGYVAHLIGKWHLGFSRAAHAPAARGFATSLCALGGSSGHWDHSIGLLQALCDDHDHGALPGVWDLWSHGIGGGASGDAGAPVRELVGSADDESSSVSYTHLTLPTIPLV